MQVDEDFRDAGAGAEIKPDIEQRAAANRHQALGNGVGERAQAGAMTASQQEGFQCVASCTKYFVDLRPLPPEKEAGKSIVFPRVRHSR